MGLLSTVVAEPYAALTTVQNYRPVLPHNSIRGLHFYAMSATITQACILLHMWVLFVHALRPQFSLFIQGRLALTVSTAATSLAKRL